MPMYQKECDKSNIFAYEVGKGFIDVEFKGGTIYRYSLETVGADTLQAMIVHAEAGEGLNAIINKLAKKS